MRWIELLLMGVAGLAGAALFLQILWNRRLKHVWPKRGEIEVVNPGGLVSGILEVTLQTRVIANRPVAGIAHLIIFYGFVTFGLKSVTHVFNGVLGLDHPISLGPLDGVLDVISVLVLASVIFMAIRRYFFMRDRLTHMLESGAVLALIGGLMITYILERPTGGSEFPVTSANAPGLDYEVLPENHMLLPISSLLTP